MFCTDSNLKFSLCFFIFRFNIAYMKHKDSCISEGYPEIHITSKTCVEVNTLKCVKDNPFLCSLLEEQFCDFIYVNFYSFIYCCKRF